MPNFIYIQPSIQYFINILNNLCIFIFIGFSYFIFFHIYLSRSFHLQ